MKNQVSYIVDLLSSEYILSPFPFANLVVYPLPFYVLFFTKHSIYAVSSFLNCISYCLLSFLMFFNSLNLYIIFKCIVPYFEKWLYYLASDCSLVVLLIVFITGYVGCFVSGVPCFRKNNLHEYFLKWRSSSASVCLKSIYTLFLVGNFFLSVRYLIPHPPSL